MLSLPERTLLVLMQRFLTGDHDSSDLILSQEDWSELMALAEEQKLLPAVFDLVCRNPSFKEMARESRERLKRNALRQATRQIIQSNEFLTLLLHAQARGLDPVVLKGITVRSLYPMPMLRPSVDEDLLVPQAGMAAWHQFLLSEGLQADEPAADPAFAAELSYHKAGSPTYIELHATLFAPDSQAYGHLNGLFEGAPDRAVQMQIQDVHVRTLAPTEHLLFLILHVYKHFIHSGVGIRPVCDIGVFAKAFGSQVDWKRLKEQLDQAHALYFAKALFQILHLYLMPEAPFFDDIEDWHVQMVDAEPLLQDILESGLHGASSLTRMHSSNMTLQAVAEQNRGVKGRKDPLTASVFLPLQAMRGRYPFLKKAPILLPLAWAMRVLDYLIKSRQIPENDAAASLRLGKDRIRLLEQYHITDPKN